MPLHVVFSPSLAKIVREASHQSARHERVIELMDDLSVGPINPAAPRSRGFWIAEELGYDWHEVCHNAEGFWAEATSPAVSPVAWVCRNYAYEYSGFLEFAWRMAERPFQVIDTSDLTLPRGTAFRSPSQILKGRLFARQTTLSNAERDQYLDLWRRLKAENAPFRVVGAPGLVSARITHFDDAILASITPEWRVGARIAGDAMRELLGRPFAQCASDKVIWSRVLAFADAGLVEVRGSGSEMLHFQVRRLP